MQVVIIVIIALISTSVSATKVYSEKSVDCRWTVGRIAKLQKTIERGGKGKESKFCSEYRKRVSELSKNNCKNKLNASLIRSC